VTEPVFSVVIPAYNGARVIADAVTSVLDQSYGNLELIVVDDGSSDGTAEVVRRFRDPRLKLLSMERNAGVDAARRAGVDASKGEIIAFLDQDDAFLREKLERHAAYLGEHPEVGFSYNPFALVAEDMATVLGAFQSPANLRLADLLEGFPLPPSMWVLRREWALRGEIWDERTLKLRGRETVFCGRLFLAGCRFGMVDRVLNYRRLGKQRRFADISACCEAERRCQELILEDARCPAGAWEADGRALINTCLTWAYYALLQGDSQVGVDLIRRAAAIESRVVTGSPCEVTRLFLHCCTTDWRADHEASLRLLFAGLPHGLLSDPLGLQWAISRGYLLRGVRACLWGASPAAAGYLELAASLAPPVDGDFARIVAHELMMCEDFHGADVAQARFRTLLRELNGLESGRVGRRLAGEYHFNRALRFSSNGAARATVAELAKAVIHAPGFLGNRGAHALFLRSLIGRPSRPNRNRELT